MMEQLWRLRFIGRSWVIGISMGTPATYNVRIRRILLWCILAGLQLRIVQPCPP